MLLLLLSLLLTFFIMLFLFIYFQKKVKRLHLKLTVYTDYLFSGQKLQILKTFFLSTNFLYILVTVKYVIIINLKMNLKIAYYKWKRTFSLHKLESHLTQFKRLKSLNSILLIKVLVTRYVGHNFFSYSKFLSIFSFYLIIINFLCWTIYRSPPLII